MTPMQEHMKRWATDIVEGRQVPDPAEDTAEDIWQSLRIFADQYLELLGERVSA